MDIEAELLELGTERGQGKVGRLNEVTVLAESYAGVSKRLSSQTKPKWKDIPL
jgi:hypothetical protein